MRNGGTFVMVAAILTAGGCGEQGKLQIRSIGSPLAAGAIAVSFRVAEGRGQFALGNVALALESFRKAAREDPGNIDALAGIAACYDRMGRFDLSRRNYEAALALAPGDPQLLTAFAASLDLQRLAPEAARVRQEIGARLAARGPVTGSVSGSAATVSQAPDAPSVTMALLPILPTTVVDAVAAVLEASGWPLNAPLTAAKPSATRQAMVESARPSGPRLERLSLGEVALITGAGPQWKVQQAEVKMRKPLTGAAAVRQAAVVRSGVRLFNAARVDKLASRARSYLTGRGWTVASVGDVVLPRSRSLILYPSDKRATAARLSAQFGFAMEQRSDVRQVTILLGRDAAGLPMLKAKSG